MVPWVVLVLGSEPLSPDGLDLYSCGMVMEINGAIASVGAGAACLDHPYNAVQWLARTLASPGAPLRAGHTVLSGALGPMVATQPRDHFPKIDRASGRERVCHYV